MLTPLIALLLSVASAPQSAPVAAPGATTALAAAPATAAPAPAPRVTDSDLAAWVAESLTHDARNGGESADALLLRKGRRPDLSIASEVTDHLTAAGVQGMVVGCADGSVVLRGKVKDAARRDKAGALAAEVAGVRSVDNLLAVPGEAATAERVERREKEASAPRAVENGATHVAGLTFLTDDGLAGRGIAVDVSGGVVKLAGEVCSTAARDYALNVASRVPGVRAVQSALTVRPSDLQDDRRLALLVHRELSNDVIVQTVSNAILVTVVNGVLTLSGSVRDDDQRDQATRVAASRPEVFMVVNALTVNENLVLPPLGRIAGFKHWDDF